jgi:pyruvate/oxaloacetate carboxyltransferase
VREDLGYIPLVTPTSQIVGTQAVLNVLTGERYKSISRETAGVLKGEYGATPAPVNATLQARVLDGRRRSPAVRRTFSNPSWTAWRRSWIRSRRRKVSTCAAAISTSMTC